MSQAALMRKTETAAPKAKVPTGASLRIGEANDAYEQEADRVADQVVSREGQKFGWSLSKIGMAAPLQRECACGGTCDDCKKKKDILQRNATSLAAAGSRAPASVGDVLSRPGSPLDLGTRSFMEFRFGHDFSSVRIHADHAAAVSARDVSANAYTVGSSIVFNQGKYQPYTPSGRRLLAHELAHVVQQSQSCAPARIQRDANDIQVEEGPKSNSILQQAFDAADARRWEVAARLANGLSPYQMKIFLSQYSQPIWRHYLYLGAVHATGVGEQSAIALATKEDSVAYQKKEDFKYRQQLAKQNGEPPPKEDDPAQTTNEPPKVLTAEEKKQKCESNASKEAMTFPLRLPRGMWRISVAPINARRTGKDILVSQPLNGVLGDPMFKREVKTLPLSTFTGGIHIAPDDYVRVRFYDDDGHVACVSGEQLLKLSEASDTAVMLSIARTALDAASILAPGAGEALVERGFSVAGARLTVAATNIALNQGLEITQQAANVHYGIQDQIHWGQIAFETLLQAVTVGLGGKLSDAAAESVAGVATGTYSKPLLKAAVETVLQGSFAVFQSVARTLFNKLQGEGKPMTFGEFMQELAEEFAQGVLFHLVMQAIPEGDGTPHTEEHGTVKPEEPLEHQIQKPVKQKHESSALSQDKPPTMFPTLSIEKSGLELDTSEGREGWNQHLEDYRAIEPDKLSKVPKKPGFGEPSREKGGTGYHSGMNFHEYSPAEVAIGLKVDWDPQAARPRKVTYNFTSESAKVPAQMTKRSFHQEPRLKGESAQSSVAAYRKSGNELGHLAQREAGKVDVNVDQALELAKPTALKVERSMDVLTNVVPMKKSLNQGAAWRSAETRTAKFAIQEGYVTVEVIPIYDEKPPRLRDGTPVPAKVRRIIKSGPTGRLMEDLTFDNK